MPHPDKFNPGQPDFRARLPFGDHIGGSEQPNSSILRRAGIIIRRPDLARYVETRRTSFLPLFPGDVSTDAVMSFTSRKHPQRSQEYEISIGTSGQPWGTVVIETINNVHAYRPYHMYEELARTLVESRLDDKTKKKIGVDLALAIDKQVGYDRYNDWEVAVGLNKEQVQTYHQLVKTLLGDRMPDMYIEHRPEEDLRAVVGFYTLQDPEWKRVSWPQDGLTYTIDAQVDHQGEVKEVTLEQLLPGDQQTWTYYADARKPLYTHVSHANIVDEGEASMQHTTVAEDLFARLAVPPTL